MRLLATVQGPYGERIALNIRQTAPAGWLLQEIALPKTLPSLVDEPEEFLPAAIPQADILLALGESTGAAQLISDIASRSGAQAVVAPIDNSAWLPQGLANQLKKELAAIRVAAVFPRPFCSLTEGSHGYGRSAQQYEDELISTFARRFGRPQLAISVNPRTGIIDHVEVKRSTACGSAYHVAQGLVGLSTEEATVRAGLMLHHYPCLCSMNKEWIDDRLYDTLMHVSGYIVNEMVAQQLGPHFTHTE